MKDFNVGTAVSDPLNDVDAVDHGSRGPIPLCDHKHIPCPESVYRTFELIRKPINGRFRSRECRVGIGKDLIAKVSYAIPTA